jgi:asparagine synthase (glutamine-hydrolysing)
MCGIAGICSTDGRPVDEVALRRMAAVLAHRGPDGEGVHIDDWAAPSAGLASRRLAVIDIAGGGQPMSTEDGVYTIVYNGELFNGDEVRRELAARGHRLRSHCDTEVVLRGYVEWGDAVLDRLNGMWGFAIWDGARRRLFLARDRLGVKPLVYADTPAGLVFASEIKALTASGLVPRALDRDALPYYLSFFAVSEPHSLVRGVRRLPAGHTLTVDADGIAERRYWDCAIPEEEDRGRETYRDEIEGLLEDSVRRRLVSDVPLGVLLSSGIDSGLVAALAARHRDDSLSTFTLGFGRPDADERAAARRVARALRTEHAETEVSPADVAARLPDLLEAYDEPGQSLLQTYWVCELASREVTVALSGLGGDELFSAYPAHVVTNLLARVDQVPASLRKPALALAGSLPGRLGRAAALAGMDSDERATRRLMHQTERGLRSDLLCPEVRAELDLDAPTRHLEAHFERTPAEHPLNRLLYVYVKTYLTDELLRASDAMSMLHSLELRTPFLDYRLVERAMSIPARHKMRWTAGKLMLRDVAGRVLPVSPPPGKRGFSPPVGAWIQGELQERVRDVLAQSAIRSRGLFDPAEAERLVTSAVAGDARAVPAVMMLYCFEEWARRWLDGRPTATGEVAPGPWAQAPASSAERDLSVIVVNWNTRERLRDCLASAEKHLSRIDHEILVVDNGSSDGSPEMVEREFPGIRLIRNDENLGFGRANNQAMRVARGRWFLLLNSDTILVDDSVQTLCGEVQRENDIGIAHCRLNFPDGRLQHTVYRFPSVKLALVEDLGLYKLMPKAKTGPLLLSGYWDYSEERDVDWVAGAFMLLPRRVFAETGGFDERLFMYGEDLEWCYRVRDHGWRIRFYPQASIIHLDHSSSEVRWGDERITLCLRRQRDIYRERHGTVRSTALTAVRVAGAALRTAYYSIRMVGGRRAPAYAEMRTYAAQVLRDLLVLAIARR